MFITFAGTGSAFTMKNYQTNIAINRGGDKSFLIDCGGDARFSLDKIGLKAKSIGGLFVTHLHADHVSGIEWLVFSTFFDKSVTEKCQLFANTEMVRDLWNTSLKGGLKSIQGQQTTLVDFFDVVSVKDNGKFQWDGITFRPTQTCHIMDGYSIVPSYGLMIEDPDVAVGKHSKPAKIFLTGDTQFTPKQLMTFYKEADLIVQDCETSPFKSGVHSHYDELITLPAEIKEKMILVHYNDNILDPWSAVQPAINQEWADDARINGFHKIGDNHGFVLCGHIIDTVSWFHT